MLAYRAAAGAEKVICFEEDSCFPLCSLADAQAAFFGQLYAILDQLGTSDYALCFSDDHNGGFRRRLFPGYKANRDGKSRPVALKFLREGLMRGDNPDAPVYIKPGLEADDCLGILATLPSFMRGRQKVIVSVDKDMKSILLLRHGQARPRHPARQPGRRRPLAHDADPHRRRRRRLPRLPEIGPMTAKKLFDGIPRDYGHLWPVVVSAFEKVGFGEAEALTQARLARILRAEDWDFNTKEVKLWTPPSTCKTR